VAPTVSHLHGFALIIAMVSFTFSRFFFYSFSIPLFSVLLFLGNHLLLRLA